MPNSFISALFLFTASTLSTSFVFAKNINTSFYQCDTDKGVVFSQFPCAEDAKLKSISTFEPKKIRSTDIDIKTLNNLEYSEKLLLVEQKLKSSQNKIRILKRNKAKKQINEEQKLERMMSMSRKKQTEKQVATALKNINKQYDAQITKEESNLKQLTKQLKELKKKRS